MNQFIKIEIVINKYEKLLFITSNDLLTTFKYNKIYLLEIINNNNKLLNFYNKIIDQIKINFYNNINQIYFKINNNKSFNNYNNYCKFDYTYIFSKRFFPKLLKLNCNKNQTLINYIIKIKDKYVIIELLINENHKNYLDIKIYIPKSGRNIIGKYSNIIIEQYCLNFLIKNELYENININFKNNKEKLNIISNRYLNFIKTIRNYSKLYLLKSIWYFSIGNEIINLEEIILNNYFKKLSLTLEIKSKNYFNNTNIFQSLNNINLINLKVFSIDCKLYNSNLFFFEQISISLYQTFILFISNENIIEFINLFLIIKIINLLKDIIFNEIKNNVPFQKIFLKYNLVNNNKFKKFTIKNKFKNTNKNLLLINETSKIFIFTIIHSTLPIKVLFVYLDIKCILIRFKYHIFNI